MFAQLRFIDAVILRQLRPELLQRVAFFRARQTGDDITRQGGDRFRGHRGVIVGRLTLFLIAVGITRAGTLQNMQLKCGERHGVEAQRAHAVRQLPAQIGAGPVQHWHKVVADGIDAAGGEIAQRLLIVGDIALPVAALGFDRLVHRHAFHHRPVQSLLRQLRPARLNFLFRPDLAVGNMV